MPHASKGPGPVRAHPHCMSGVVSSDSEKDASDTDPSGIEPTWAVGDGVLHARAVRIISPKARCRVLQNREVCLHLLEMQN